ncbi:DUF2249 domain-containing protein [Pseudoduganella albidiflava]|uniref:DUF2249 domain-containing protein n=1 Tax=Pseudoduganella albidiflava TaxID=321983 RepID=A0A411WXS4_9BURK|nr:DUF2249 domain-containing protein [Pseudoduganella albidiflava]QBI01492.1 DUF2249 domain-containing protein [Pseudoduganella albidiflava]GGY35321.1 hypothetical protein GCM10007387_16660 [Pseudoduganella albidiflava]
MSHHCSHPAVHDAPHDASQPDSGHAVHPFDARGVARRFRHAAIFGALDALTPGEIMRFYNDHDPLPLLRQIGQYYGPRVRARYVSRTPGEIVIDFLATGE